MDRRHVQKEGLALFLRRFVLKITLVAFRKVGNSLALVNVSSSGDGSMRNSEKVKYSAKNCIKVIKTLVLVKFRFFDSFYPATGLHDLETC